jgi:hypothetical protein
MNTELIDLGSIWQPIVCLLIMIIFIWMIINLQIEYKLYIWIDNKPHYKGTFDSHTGCEEEVERLIKDGQKFEDWSYKKVYKNSTNFIDISENNKNQINMN